MNKSNLYIFLGKVFHKRVFPKNHEFLYSYKSLYSKNILSFSNYSFYKQKDVFFNYDFNTKQVNEGIIPWLKKIKTDFSLNDTFDSLTYKGFLNFFAKEYKKNNTFYIK